MLLFLAGFCVGLSTLPFVAWVIGLMQLKPWRQPFPR